MTQIALSGSQWVAQALCTSRSWSCMNWVGFLSMVSPQGQDKGDLWLVGPQPVPK